jgi:spore germination cell wall hydrolase CwlJ-like protein
VQAKAQAIVHPPQIHLPPKDEVICLTRAIHFETRGKPTEARKAVGWAILNRQGDSRFPLSLCSIIRERGQFPWVNYRVVDTADYNHANEVAIYLLSRYTEELDPTRGATYFASGLDSWFRAMINKGMLIETHRSGGHMFFRLKDVNHFE